MPVATKAQPVSAYKQASRYDPTHTTMLRAAFVRDMNARFNKLKRAIRQAIIDKDCFGLKTENLLALMDLSLPQDKAFAFTRSAEKVQGFMKWLEEQNKIFTESGGLWGNQSIRFDQLGIGVEDVWTNKYIYSAYQQGIARGRQELLKAGYEIPTLEESGGLNAVFNQPFHVDRLGLVYSRTYEGLKGITASMSTQISRILAEGIAEGRNPRELANILARTVSGPVGGLGITDKLGRFIPAKRRAEILARTEIIRAHHMATIQEYRNWGLEGVQVQAEWATAGDDRVCDECASLEGKIFTLEEIESMIPRHPQCRCIALPIEQKDVEEKKAEQEDKQNEDLSITLADGNSMEIPIEFRPPQECYENARLEYWAQKAKGNDVKYKLGLIYSQGDPYPIQHAWVETKDGKIIDSTLFLKTGHIHGPTISAIENAQVAYLYEGPMKRVTYYVGKTVDESNLLVSLRQGTRQVTKPMVGDNFWQLLYQDKKWLQIQKEIKTLGLPSELLSEKQLLAIQYKMGQGAPFPKKEGQEKLKQEKAKLAKIAPPGVGKVVAPSISRQWKILSDYTELEETFSKQLRIYGINAEQYTMKARMDILNSLGSHFMGVLDNYPGLMKMVVEAEYDKGIRFFEIVKGRAIRAGNIAGEYFEGKRSMELAGGLSKTIPIPTIGRKTWDVGKDFFTLFRHEYGHHVQTIMERTFKSEWATLFRERGEAWFAANVSRYGGSNYQEAFAECFAAYTSPRYGEATRKLPAEIEDFFRRLLG